MSESDRNGEVFTIPPASRESFSPLNLLPFLRWSKGYDAGMLRADFLAGLTVALVLIPQSMAYAQLAGLPAYYGLYAAFLPPMIASLFGSSRQLATGPVAIVSLMTATALAPYATEGSAQFAGYAVLLALLVGFFQFLLGALRLGLVVNFLSHPVINGFTNAAAIIIATSQLSKLFGVYVDSAEHHYETIHAVIVAAIDFTHWPTLLLGTLAFVTMAGLKRINPRIPNVLVAVALTTLISWSMGFEHNQSTPLNHIEDEETRELVALFNQAKTDISERTEERSAKVFEIQQGERDFEPHALELLVLHHERDQLTLGIENANEDVGEYRAALRRLKYVLARDGGEEPRFFLQGRVPSDKVPEERVWRLRVGNGVLDESAIVMQGGGAVVAAIPPGLPELKRPALDVAMIANLFSMAVVISLLGFMEAISIAKAMAAKTGQNVDPNQELIGQGLANIVGAFGQSYPVSGSFSRSAVNLQAGAVTGFSNVFSSVLVILTLLFFTPLLYHLPQAVLAAVIMMAVIGLIDIRGFVHAWQAQKYDGVISVISFVATLYFAPHLDRGIIIGVILSIVLFLFRTMKPRIVNLSKEGEGSYRSAERFDLETCRHLAVVRFPSSLYFVNVNYLEEVILEVMASMSELKHIVIVGNGINQLDASGEELLDRMVRRVRSSGFDISFCGLNDSVLDVMSRTGLYEKIGADHLFRGVSSAVAALYEKTHRGSLEKECPLIQVCGKNASPQNEE